jgi:hypothetical protein
VQVRPRQSPESRVAGCRCTWATGCGEAQYPPEKGAQTSSPAQARGELILGGALADPVDTAILLFRGESPEVVERFVAADPYVKNGLVARWRIRPWTTVVGEAATAPVRPGQPGRP